MNVTVDQRPKGHPEVDGEGIEYTWANFKISLRSVLLDNRRTKAQFLDTVKLAISRDVGAQLTKTKKLKISGRAKDFISAYYLLHNKNQNESSVQPNSSNYKGWGKHGDLSGKHWWFGPGHIARNKAKYLI
eukprot:7937577-Ditylum_brightwellii.AAC.1